ncbi:hypothetical protein L207DRAFT_472785 [Hyaloscypha variabilis F]|uniref:Uncharacterized protein n=1 Tax=Hyaloscypha variabilis (strain UAMH 11265 / GT02V1 / F) TaxID=1149755 RepID=A0A2J6QYM1_HYAVF|nr:hypothetical protein L207DRAFT_472785 [Hyaloscypha variabilis F]
MFARAAWPFLALSCVSAAAAQSLLYQLTMSVSNPAPVPGQPFTITWTGGEANEAVYIVLNNYFPDLPNQDIIYGGTDILSNAPNNGSWTYNVPLNIEAGRHSFSIGYNPVMLSDTSGIFTILPSQTSYVPPGSTSTPTGAAAWTYNGCGLVPFPDYTYTGYQPPCTTTVNGKVETLYPIVPASDSSIFYPNLINATPAPTTISPSTITTVSNSRNTAFATGPLAQALQCRYAITPTVTRITSASVTTLFSLVGCSTLAAAPSTSNTDGVCHTSGYTTFSVSGTSSVCCPNGWATTPLNTDLYCFTEASVGVKRQASTETLGMGISSTLVELQGLVFTSAGVVTQEAAVQTGSATTGGGGTVTGAVSSESETKKSEGVSLKGQGRGTLGMVGLVALCNLFL